MPTRLTALPRTPRRQSSEKRKASGMRCIVDDITPTKHHITNAAPWLPHISLGISAHQDVILICQRLATAVINTRDWPHLDRLDHPSTNGCKCGLHPSAMAHTPSSITAVDSHLFAHCLSLLPASSALLVLNYSINRDLARPSRDQPCSGRVQYHEMATRPVPV